MWFVKPCELIKPWSMLPTTQNMPEGKEVHLLLVFDGWNKMTDSMKRYPPPPLFSALQLNRA